MSKISQETWDLYTEVVGLLAETIDDKSNGRFVALMRSAYETKNIANAAPVPDEIESLSGAKQGWLRSASRAVRAMLRDEDDARQAGLRGVATAIAESGQDSKKLKALRCLTKMDACVKVLRDESVAADAKARAFEAWCVERDELSLLLKGPGDV